MLRKNRIVRGGKKLPKHHISNRSLTNNRATLAKDIAKPAYRFPAHVFKRGTIDDFGAVVLYNFHANGDLHVSRSYIKQLISLFGTKPIYYQHHNSQRVLADLPNIKQCNLSLPKDFRYSGWGIQDNTLFVNTWYMTNGAKYYRGSGCSIFTLDSAFRQELQYAIGLKFSVPLMHCVPTIDYSYFDVGSIESKLKNLPNPNKLILISNGNVTSKQAKNFDFNPVISNLANKYPNYTYLVTNAPKTVNSKNVFYTQDIIGRSDCDLNENAYIARYCKVIIGRSSGAYTFSVANKDLWTHPNRKFIGFVYPHCRAAAFFGLETLNKTNQFVYSPAVTTEQALAAIDGQIKFGI